MNIYIDCEWNSFGGNLISMALCAENGEEFYEVLPCENPHEWVVINVSPVLDKKPICIELFTELLGKFLRRFHSVKIISDWPEDIERFCHALITGPGERLDTPPLTMSIIRIDAESDKPHNALHDARGLRKALTTEE